MTPSRLLRTAIIPALAELESSRIADTKEARRFLVAIALQESALRHRRQVIGGQEVGQAVSFWQFEQGGGCAGVLRHSATADRIRAICSDYNVTATPEGLWHAMRYQDIVAAAASRLLIYTLPHALPRSSEDGWRQYIEAWRPGKPHQSTWARNWDLANDAVSDDAS